jgi:hypothetical protein
MWLAMSAGKRLNCRPSVEIFEILLDEQPGA